MLYQVLAVCGDYELRVTIHSFRNPGGTCANSYCNDTRCCDYGLKPCPNPCDYYFSLCVRPAGTPVSSVRLINRGHCVTYDTDVSPHISNGKTFTDVVFGNTPNPIKFTGTQWVSDLFPPNSSMWTPEMHEIRSLFCVQNVVLSSLEIRKTLRHL